MMKRFESDYLEGAHPDVLRALIETNGEQTPGYGEDPHCEAARALLRERCALPEGEVQFLVGGTQVNRTVIASILRPHQGVVAADTGHIAAHETGAIENSGHKVLTVPNTDGKIAAAQVEELCRAHYADASFEHTVQPGMVYISNPTEFGTVYTRGELEALHAVCKARHLPLFIDGARLGAALYSPVCDYTLADMAHMCEVFTIGGTKMGLLFGEAAVFSAPELAKDFRYFIKQNGGMLAKGRLLGVQFTQPSRMGSMTASVRRKCVLRFVCATASAPAAGPSWWSPPPTSSFPFCRTRSSSVSSRNFRAAIRSLSPTA